MIIVELFGKTGAFAENKDIARDIRVHTILPALDKGEDIILDFSGVTSATQSFVHAMISDALRKHGDVALERISFKSCNDVVRKIIGIVVDYMQESN